MTALVVGLLGVTLQPANAQNWDGPCIGLHAGWINSEQFDLEDFSPGAAPTVLFGNNVPGQLSNDDDGFIGGVQAGVNKQTGSWVI